MATLLNINRDPKKVPDGFKVTDCLPKWGGQADEKPAEDPEDGMSGERIMGVMESFMRQQKIRSAPR